MYIFVSPLLGEKLNSSCTLYINGLSLFSKGSRRFTEKTITEIAKEPFFLEAKMPVICIDIIRIGIYILIS
ncbi:hypothetical protein HY02_03805 [Peptococcaceae bacterium SCADC1_2_3]|nr:hypothetical protein HY02_03805 [Peptococcaceae bacterium SCADC1_2_3]